MNFRGLIMIKKKNQKKWSMRHHKRSSSRADEGGTRARRNQQKKSEKQEEEDDDDEEEEEEEEEEKRNSISLALPLKPQSVASRPGFLITSFPSSSSSSLSLPFSSHFLLCLSIPFVFTRFLARFSLDCWSCKVRDSIRAAPCPQHLMTQHKDPKSENPNRSKQVLTSQVRIHEIHIHITLESDPITACSAEIII